MRRYFGSLSFFRQALADFSRIHTLVICGCGFPDWEGNFDGLKQMCKVCFCGPDMVCVPEAPLLKKFEAAGEEYAASLTLSPETVAALETPMIPKEDYIRAVNGG